MKDYTILVNISMDLDYNPLYKIRAIIEETKGEHLYDAVYPEQSTGRYKVYTITYKTASRPDALNIATKIAQLHGVEFRAIKEAYGKYRKLSSK